MLLTKPLGYSLNRFARSLAGVADVLLSTVAGAVSSPNRGHRPQETRRGCLYSGALNLYAAISVIKPQCCYLPN